MKKMKLLLPIVALCFATSCEEKIKTWSGADRISFETRMVSDTLKTYTFVFEDKNVTEHTLWLNVCTEGFVFDVPRAVTIRQVSTGGNDAVPGVHYVAFDDPQVENQYVIPAGAASVNIPIILLRHSSLQTTIRTLHIELVGNNNFLLSTEKNKLHRHIVFSDMYVMAQMWGAQGTVTNYFGTYGQVKHGFMVSVTDMLFDNNWFDANFRWDTGPLERGWIPRDAGYMTFLRGWLREELQKRNAREGNTLRERNGVPVSF
ncbi:MAG: DUF4843 domain-containing protein [Bacteroidales bacterium]|nr:DUF4843 domain-containing protein [Bacteroidales bacterium]